MANSRKDFEAMSVEQLNQLLSEGNLYPGSVDLCKEIIEEKSSTPNNTGTNLETDVTTTPYIQNNEIDGNQVTIVDIKMPFTSIVVFMVKAVIASIPAFIILSLIGYLIIAVFGSFFG